LYLRGTFLYTQYTIIITIRNNFFQSQKNNFPKLPLLIGEDSLLNRI
jgi:hypothetical protein